MGTGYHCSTELLGAKVSDKLHRRSRHVGLLRSIQRTVELQGCLRKMRELRKLQDGAETKRMAFEDAGLVRERGGENEPKQTNSARGTQLKVKRRRRFSFETPKFQRYRKCCR